MLDSQIVSCPNCGESFEVTLDLSAGNQDYIEDCYVCCRPIRFILQVNDDGELMDIKTMREDE